MTTNRRTFITGLGFAVVGATLPLPPMIAVAAESTPEVAPATTLSFDEWLNLLGKEFLDYVGRSDCDVIDEGFLFRTQTYFHRYAEECESVGSFLVICNHINNPPESIDEGKVVCEMLVRAPGKLRPVLINMVYSPSASSLGDVVVTRAA